MIDKTLKPLFVNVVGSILTVVIIGLPVVLYGLIWRENALAVYTGASSVVTVTLLALAVFFVSIVIHEAIHGIGYRMGGVAWDEIKFGFQWKAMMPYAHCKAPMRAGAYKLAVALPGIILGLIPTIVGILIHGPWLTLYGAMMLAGAVGDMLILALLLPIQADVIVQDHPTKPGFQILSEAQSRKGQSD
jgi:hypothetical protein